ncbi:MAG TPA: hypothetical protein VK003_08145, partial [Oceanobacillus sp.]|nr:hypothetical protein [Oceanobacillus sp.]
MKTLWKSLTLLLIAVFWTPLHVFSQSPNRVCAEATTQGEPTAISFEGTDENGEYVRVVDFMPRLEDHLNSGGTPSTLMAALDEAAAQHEDPWIYDVVLADVTGDDNVEILVQLTWAGGALDGGIFAYRCDQGDYVGYVITP